MATAPDERRRETGAASARSLLLTVLGEFVLSRDGRAWTGALVAALGEVGVEEKAARQALSRTAAEDLLRPERDLSVPETQRQLRHRLRTRLTWAGLGSPLPGVWVTPDTGKEKEVAAIVEELQVQAFSFTGPFGAVGDQMQVVADAWTLGDVERRYGELLAAFSVDSVRTAADAFRAQIQLVQEWRRFPFLDPALPMQLLPASWPGPAAASLFHRRHASWHERAQAYWEQLCRQAERRT